MTTNAARSRPRSGSRYNFSRLERHARSVVPVTLRPPAPSIYHPGRTLLYPGCMWEGKGKGGREGGAVRGDLREKARDMEREKYPERAVARPVPVRVLGKRSKGDGRSEFLGSRWNEGSDSAEGARASRRRP